jgi:hypothetical protein
VLRDHKLGYSKNAKIHHVFIVVLSLFLVSGLTWLNCPQFFGWVVGRKNSYLLIPRELEGLPYTIGKVSE